MFLSLEKTQQVEWRATSPADPWQFLLRLEDVLNTDGSVESLFGGILRLFCMLDGIQSGLIAGKSVDGSLVFQTALGTPEDLAHSGKPISSVAMNAKRAGHKTSASTDAGSAPADPAWQDLAIKTLEAGETVVCTPPLPATMARDGCKSAAAIILRDRTTAYGVLMINSAVEGFFEHLWPRESLAHIGTMIGQALAHRQRTASVGRVELLYKTLVSAADILLHARSEKAILRKICTQLVDSGLFVSSRIGQIHADGSFHNQIVHLSSSTRKLRNLVSKFSPSGTYEMLSVRAWRTEKIQISNDYLNDPRFTPWHSLAQSIGTRSIAILPIFRGGKRWALLSVDSAQTAFFDTELKELLEQLARLIGHTLDELDIKRTLNAQREEQSRIARLDTLTGLPNRLALRERLAGDLASAQRNQTVLGIGMFDLDDFKQVNAYWGHSAGDYLLHIVSERLRSTLRQVDFVARLGGDEFALILNSWNPEHVNSFCARLYDAIHAPVILPDGQSVSISFCIGFTLFPADNADSERLMHHADAALHAAKAAKRNGGKFWEVYQKLDAAGKAQFYYRSLLRQGALVTHFQPVIDVLSGQVVSAEALARLQDGGRLIQPAVFLPDLTLDDRNELFRQVLQQSLQQVCEWDNAGHHLGLSVNVDAQILLLDATLDYIMDRLTQTGIAPSRLTLEILETHEFIDLKQASLRIGAIRATGIKIALDDLGAGYSSIMKLRDLPLDFVKLDRAFIASLRQRPDGLVFIMAFQALVMSLGMALVVEGVETDDILDGLRMLGPGLAQGYGIARPMPGEALSGWLRSHKPVNAKKEPTTLLGAYAVHLGWLHWFHAAHASAPILSYLKQHGPHGLHGFFQMTGMADTEMAQAYEAFQEILLTAGSGRLEIGVAAEQFRTAMIEALAAQD